MMLKHFFLQGYITRRINPYVEYSDNSPASLLEHCTVNQMLTIQSRLSNLPYCLRYKNAICGREYISNSITMTEEGVGDEWASDESTADYSWQTLPHTLELVCLNLMNISFFFFPHMSNTMIRDIINVSHWGISKNASCVRQLQLNADWLRCRDAQMLSQGAFPPLWLKPRRVHWSLVIDRSTSHLTGNAPLLRSIRGTEATVPYVAGHPIPNYCREQSMAPACSQQTAALLCGWLRTK